MSLPTPSPLMSNQAIVKTPNISTTQDSAPAPSSKILPRIIEIKLGQTVPSSWKKFNDRRGYSFSYPPNWFVEGNTVQNWNPQKVINPRPLSGEESKWDVSFDMSQLVTITSAIEQISEEIRVDTIEKATTADGSAVYFVQGTDSFFGNEDNRTPVIGAIIINNKNQFFTWFSIYSGNKITAKELKQIVLTLRRTDQ